MSKSKQTKGYAMTTAGSLRESQLMTRIYRRWSNGAYEYILRVGAGASSAEYRVDSEDAHSLYMATQFPIFRRVRTSEGVANQVFIAHTWHTLSYIGPAVD